MQFERSLQHYKRAARAIPMATSTLSRSPHLLSIGAAPLYIRSASGCRVTDIDGNEFIDYSMALGAILLGHGYSAVNEAAKAGIDDGLLFTLAPPEEAELAEKLIERIPCADRVRFAKNGSDACEAAVRIARHYTGRNRIITLGGYHGFHDWFTASTERHHGIPEAMRGWVVALPYNDLEAVRQAVEENPGEFAAIMMEPIISAEPQDGYLRGIRDLADAHGIVLVYDEMKTGFRFGDGGGQDYFGVTPDLATFAKSMSNGFPISALAGDGVLMGLLEDERCFFSASYATEKSSILAALATLQVLDREPVTEHVWKIGQRLKEGTSKILEQNFPGGEIICIGLAPMSHIVFGEASGYSPNELKTFVQQECVKQGVLFVGYHHPSFAHQDEDIERTLDVYNDVFAALQRHLRDESLLDALEGSVLGTPSLRKV